MVDYSLVSFMEERLKNTPVAFNRYMYGRINWGSRLVGLTGPRGVGKAGMIGQLRDDTGGMRGLGKVEKVFLDNPTLMTVLSGGRPNVGNLRETFFYNQMRVDNDVMSSRMSDFRINDATFEIGGRNKGQRQIRDVAEGYVVKDDIEYRHANIIPLFLFGLTY